MVVAQVVKDPNPTPPLSPPPLFLEVEAMPHDADANFPILEESRGATKKIDVLEDHVSGLLITKKHSNFGVENSPRSYLREKKLGTFERIKNIKK